MEPVSRKRNTIANLVYQYGTLVIAIVRGIVLIPIYLKMINLELFGAWLASGNIISWLALMDPGLNELLRQQTAKFFGQKDWDSLGKAMGTAWVLMTVFSIVTIGIGYLLAQYIPALFLSEAEKIAELRLSIFIASIGLALVFFSGVPVSILQGLQRSERFIVIYLIASASGITCNLILLFKGYGLVCIPIDTVIAGVVMTIGCSLNVLNLSIRKLKVRPRWCSEYLNNIKGLIGSTFFIQISRAMARHSDEFIVGIFLGTGAVPVVAFANRLWNFVLEFGQRMSVAFMPSLAHLWGEGDRQRFMEISVRMLRVSMWVVAFGATAALGLNRSFINLWVGSKFFAGIPYNFLMALSVFAYVYVYGFSQVHYAANDIKGPAWAGVAQNAVRIGIILIFLASFGKIVVLPIATLITSGAVYLIYFRKRFFSMSQFRPKSPDKSAIFSLISAVAVGFLFIVLIGFKTWPGLITGLLIALSLTAGLLAAVDKAFREFAVSIIMKVWKLISQ